MITIAYLNTNPVRVTKCPRNFRITEADYEPGRVIAHGATIKEVLENFIDAFEAKYDTDITKLILRDAE